MALGKRNNNKDDLVQIIVTMKEFDNTIKSMTSHYHIKYVLPMIDSVVVEIKKDVTNRLFSCNCSRNAEPRVEMDSVIQAQMNRASRIVQLDAARDEGLFGDGVGVAVMDTGVYPHSDLISGRNRIVAFYDVVNGRRYPYDDNGHGTQVCSPYSYSWMDKLRQKFHYDINDFNVYRKKDKKLQCKFSKYWLNKKICYAIIRI